MDAPTNASPEDSHEAPREDAPRDEAWEQIRAALRGLQFGSVTVLVQDGVVVQIDRTEKRRIRRPESPSA